MNKKPVLKKSVYFITLVFLVALIAIIFAVVAVYSLLKNNPEFKPNHDTPVVSGSTEENEPAILYLTTMTHLENNLNFDTNEIYFKKVAGQMRYGMDLAEPYKAIMTFESGLDFAEGNINFGDNVMKETLERGFGVGTHVDLAAKQKMPVETATQIIKEHKEAVDVLIGAENNFSCSGVNGNTDWYTASKNGGCKLIDGVVGFAYLSMPMENRPVGWTDTAIIKEKFHYAAPVGDVRFYPFWISDAQDFVEDAGGDMLLSSGETMSLAMFAEAGGRNSDRPECASNNSCFLTIDDVTTVINDIKDLAASRDTTRIAKYNVYFPVNLFVPENEEILKKFFSETQKLEEQGIVKWASQKEVYEAMVAER